MSISLENPALTAADEALREVLRSQYLRLPALILDSPPGAGKTGVVVRLAAQALAVLEERCMVVTQTNRQSFDVARRLACGFPRLAFTLFCSADLTLPADLKVRGNLRVVHKTEELPSGPCVVLANAKKWAWVSEACEGFDCQLIDEAYQLHDAGFHLIAGLAERVVLVGDPGQIDPVVSCEVERWTDDPAGPHRPCPTALLARYPDLPRMALPISRRLVADTVSVVQPAFYPDLPFAALCDQEDRGLELAEGASQDCQLLRRACDGESLLLYELPEKLTGEVDEDLADAMVSLIHRLCSGEVLVRDGASPAPLLPDQIGVVCAHVSQVSAVRERLSEDFAEVLVETSNRFQGLERAVILVHHPLSGRATPRDFHLDAGRLCVMLSRHRVACFVFARAGIEEHLRQDLPQSDRVLGAEEDPAFDGWRAQEAVMRALRGRSGPKHNRSCLKT